MWKIYKYSLILITMMANAQTDTDALMMSKYNFCFGAVMQYSDWKEYWEGTFKRDNLNLGTVSTKGLTVMGNYGISDKLNFLASVPYFETNASAGTMKGQKGIQDLTMTLKYMPIEKDINNTIYSVYILGGYSIPISNYPADYLPLSLGSGSKTMNLRLMGDIQKSNYFVTISAAYLKRSNVKIDKDSYLTDEIQYSNLVKMPDAITYNFRLGYRSERLIAEAVVDNFITQSGGFDITKNNMPFPSNTMNVFKVGVNAKYTLKSIPELAIVVGYNKVIKGRNVGEASTYYAGIFYLLSFESKRIKNNQNEE